MVKRDWRKRRNSSTPRFTNLLDAARNNSIELIETALRNGEDINQQDETGNHALHQAAMFNLYDVISYLIFLGADPEIKNKEGNKVSDICRDDGMKSFLKQTKRLTLREDHGKVNEEVASISCDTEVTFVSHHVTVTCSNLTENENVTLRCRSVRLEEVGWRFLEATETTCSDVYILSTNRANYVESCEVEIPIYNLPSSTEEIVIKTNMNLAVKAVTVYDRKRVSYCKGIVDMSPVLSLVAVCRQKTEVFDVAGNTVLLESQLDKHLKIEIPDNSVISTGQLRLQIYNSTDFAHLFHDAGVLRSTGIVQLATNDLELSKDILISLPLSDGNNSGKTRVYSLQSFDDGSDVSVLTCDPIESGPSMTVSNSPRGWLVAVETNESDTKSTKESVRVAMRKVVNKEASLQFQIGSKQGRNQQKRCKIIVTCSPEEEVDKTVALWERDGFHFQWCTDIYKATSGDLFSITLSGSMVFCNGFAFEKLQFHPRRRNYAIFEVMSNDVLSNVNLTNVDIQPIYSNLKPIINHSIPMKKNVYIRKTSTLILDDVGKSEENELPELDREASNISKKSIKTKKKKKKGLIRKFSRENTKELKANIDQEQNEQTSVTNTPIDDDENKASSIFVREAKVETTDTHDEEKEPKHKELTNISSETLTMSLTSVDVEETTKGQGKLTDTSDKSLPAISVLESIVSSSHDMDEDSVMTSSRPVTTRSVLLENPAVNLPVEKTFFSAAYIAVILDEIGENWLVVFVLMGIPFDVIDNRLLEWHGRLPLHELLLKINTAFNNFGHITGVSTPTHVFLAFPHQYLHNILSKPLTTFSHKSDLLQEWRDENAYHIHQGVPRLLSALRKGGRWDLSVSVQRRLKIWHDQNIAVEDPLYKWLETAYADSDVFIPADYPRPMSDEFLVMFVPEVHFIHHVTTALSMPYEEFYDIQENIIYSNDTLKLMKILTLYRVQKVNVLEMLEELIAMCDDLDFVRASQIIIVSLKGWLNRSAAVNDPLKSATERLVSKLLQDNRKCTTPHSIFRQRLDVRSALKVLRTPSNQRRRLTHSEYGKPSTSK